MVCEQQKWHIFFLTQTMLNPGMFRFENSVELNQLTSEKPAEQDPPYFTLWL